MLIQHIYSFVGRYMVRTLSFKIEIWQNNYPFPGWTWNIIPPVNSNKSSSFQSNRSLIYDSKKT